MLTLLFSLSSAAMGSYSDFWESSLAAKTTAPRNLNVYETIFEAPITGTTRGAHRASANRYLANQMGNDAGLAGMMNQELGTNVLGHMQSGKSLLNPPGKTGSVCNCLTEALLSLKTAHGAQHSHSIRRGFLSHHGSWEPP